MREHYRRETQYWLEMMRWLNLKDRTPEFIAATDEYLRCLTLSR